MALIGTFNTEFSLNEVSFDTESSLDVQEVNFNTCFLNGRVLRTGKILSATTAYWNSKPGLITENNTIYIYTDYRQEERQGEIVNIPGLKIGDGLAYLIDIPFIDEDFRNHIEDTVIHVTAAEKALWNDKVRALLDNEDEENLMLIP